MTYGVGSEGFTLKRLEDIIDEIKDEFPDIDTNNESVMSQIIAPFSNQLTEVWELAQNAYNSSSPVLSAGVTLDNNIALNGIERLDSAPTIVDVSLSGDVGTIVTTDVQVKSSINSELFQLQGQVTLGKTGINRVYIVVDNVQNSTVYTLTINTTNYNYTSSGSATSEEIVHGLYTEINNHSGKQVTPTKLSDTLKIESISDSSFDLDYTSDLNHLNVGVFESVNHGSIVTTVNSIDTIEVGIIGLNSVLNYEEGTPGREVETDTELRLRQTQSHNKAGGGVLSAIIAKINDDVDNVTSVSGYSNRENTTVDSRPPHSMEIIVVGGEDSEIAEKLWEVAGGGITYYGNTFYDITDSNGDTQRIYWSRPTPKYAWVIADLTMYTEEQFPDDGVDQVKDQIIEYGNSTNTGVDIIPGRVKKYIHNITGIEDIALQIAITDTEVGTPSYQTTKISIGESEYSSWDLSRITINVL